MADFAVGVTLRADGSGLVGGLNPSVAALNNVEKAERDVARGANDMASSTDKAASSARRSAAAFNETNESVKRTKISFSNFGQQMQDVSQGLTAGINPAVIFGQQAGQIAYSLENVGGKLGSVAKFLSSGWGAAILGAVTVGGMFASKLFETSEASKKAAEESEKHKEALQNLIKAQNNALLSTSDLLRQTAIQTEADRVATQGIIKKTIAQLEYAKALQAATVTRSQGPGQRGEIATLGLEPGNARIAGLEAELAKQRAALVESTKQAAIAQGRLVSQLVTEQSTPAGKVAAKFAADQARLINSATAANNYNAASLAKLTAARDAELKRIQDTGKALTTNREVGRSVSSADAAGIIRGIGGTVTGGDRTYARQAELYARYRAGNGPLAAKPGTSNHEQGLALDIRKEAGISLATIKKAFGEKGVRITELLDEGDHFHVAWARSAADSKALSEANRDNAKATRDAATAQRELDADLGAIIAKLDPATASANAYAEQLAKISRLQAAGRITGEQAGGYRVDAGLEQFDAQQKIFADKAQALFKGLGPEWDRALNDPLGKFDVDMSALMKRAGLNGGDAFRYAVQDATDDIANQIAQAFGGKAGYKVGSALDLIGGRPQLDTARLSKSFEVIAKNGGISPDAAKKIGGFAAKGLEGAAVGGQINKFLEPLGKALGFKTSKLGSQIGGAAGSFLPIPFGKEIGAVVGSVIGGLFKSTPKGSATITSVAGKADYTGSGKLQAGLVGAAGAVQDGLQGIIDALGGTAGDFAVSIGKGKKDKFVVDNSGKGSVAYGKSNDGITAYDTVEEAQTAALRNAIADGAISGISAAMKKALAANDDVTAGVKEALKVRDVEDIIGGLGATLTRQFKTFETQAKERVRIAQQYGFDVVKIEEQNAKDRKKLLDDTIGARVGSLQDLLKNINFGDLFEGSLSDQRNKLLSEIDKTKADALNGVDGSADTLATLNRSLLDLSKNAFGTAGPEYSADRSSAVDSANAIIKFETDRANAAAKAAQETRDLANENNDQNAQLIAGINGLPANIAAALAAYQRSGGGSGSTPYRASVL